MKQLLTLLVFSAGLALAQPTFNAYYEATLAGSPAVVTVQQPAANAASTVRFKTASVYCSVACDVTVERSGTAATSTALTPVSVNASMTAAAKTKAFSASNAGVGTVLNKFTIGAGGTMAIDLMPLTLSGAGTDKNLTFRTSSVTGTVRITIQFEE